MKRNWPVQLGCGVLLMSLGTVVLAGWVLQRPAMVQLHPQFVAMVCSTALCFLLLGIAFALGESGQRKHDALRATVGLAVIAISTPPLLGALFDIDLGLDFATFHGWVADSNPRPGRMAPNTAIGFILVGLVLALVPRVWSRASGRCVQVATMLVLLLGLTGLAGYALQLDLMYPSFKVSRMAPHTAVGMTVTGLALWHSWSGRDWFQGRHYFHDVEKIAFVGTALLVIVGATAGVAGMAAQQRTLERNFGERLRMDLRHRVALLDAEVSSSIDRARTISALLERVGIDASAGGAITDLYRADAQLLAGRDSAMVAHDATGQEILRAGHFANASIEAPLDLDLPATLIWGDGFRLRIVAPVRNGDLQVGNLTLEQPLPMLSQQFSNGEGLGKTGEVALCVPADELKARCFPQLRNPKVYLANRHNIEGKETAMSLALNGRSGTFKGLDYRGHTVLGEYRSLASAGLGYVVKVHTQELFSPIRRGLQWTLPLLLLTIAIGAVLLRLQVAPLATRLMQFERAAIDRETHIRTVVASVGDGIITLDKSSQIESINSAAARIFGYTPAEVTGTSIERLIPAELRAAHAAGVHNYLNGGAPAVIGRKNVQLPGLRKDGSIVPLELTVNRMDASGGPLFVGIVRDITERKAIELDLQQRNAALEALNSQLVSTQHQLLQSEKLSSVGQLAAGVAHEINNPVGYVYSNLGSLDRYVADLLRLLQAYAGIERDLQPASPSLSTVAHVKASIDFDFLVGDLLTLIKESREGLERVRKIVQDLKDFSYVDAPEWQLADLHEGLESTLNLAAHELKYKAEVVRDYGELPRVWCLPFQLNQVFLNLLINASHAIERRGLITVRTRRIGSEVMVQIADDGRGIAAEALPHIFEPFFTTKPVGSGTGLGLSVSWGIVNSHGGSIDVHSTPGIGTEFTIRLPIQPPGATDSATAASGSFEGPNACIASGNLSIDPVAAGRANGLMGA